MGGGGRAPGGAGQPCCAAAWPPSPGSFLCALLELTAYGCLLYWSAQYFGLEINWEKRLLDSRVGTSHWGHGDGCSLGVPGAGEGPSLTPWVSSMSAFTYHEFTTWLRVVTLPLVGLAFLSLSWEILAALYRWVMGGAGSPGSSA